MKINVLSHNLTNTALVMFFTVDGAARTKIVESSQPNWNQLVGLYRAGKYAECVPLLDMAGAIESKFRGKFTVRGNEVLYKGQPVHGYLIERILFFMRELPNQAERLLKFAENLYSNPDPRVIEQLYKFLEHKHMPITDDGCFLAYKGVGGDYYSITGGRIKVIKGKVNKEGQIWNGVGAHVIVERPQVCADPNVGCSSGLHVGSWEYANGFKSYQGHLMVVKVNPKHVCSVPHDCSWQKCRACEYEVIAEEGRKLSEKRDGNFDKVSAVRQQFNRDSLGRFSKYHRDASGRFTSGN
jgi:hypothetical protein